MKTLSEIEERILTLLGQINCPYDLAQVASSIIEKSDVAKLLVPKADVEFLSTGITQAMSDLGSFRQGQERDERLVIRAMTSLIHTQAMMKTLLQEDDG